MPSTTKQPGQFIVLMTGDIDINHPSLAHYRQNIIVTNKQNDILMLIETTQFDLILLDLAVVSVPDRLHQPWRPELITRIKDPLGINNTTPVIAMVNPTENIQGESQCRMEFDDWLIKPITEERLNEIIDLWQTTALASDYIQIIQSKTKNNQRLTLTIFEKLFEELPLQIIDIEDALKKKQYDLARDINHKLNGSVSFCGLQDIQQPAHTLESCLLSNNFSAIDQCFLILQQCTLNFTRHQKFILTKLGKH